MNMSDASTETVVRALERVFWKFAKQIKGTISRNGATAERYQRGSKVSVPMLHSGETMSMKSYIGCFFKSIGSGLSVSVAGGELTKEHPQKECESVLKLTKCHYAYHPIDDIEESFWVPEIEREVDRRNLKVVYANLELGDAEIVELDLINYRVYERKRRYVDIMQTENARTEGSHAR